MCSLSLPLSAYDDFVPANMDLIGFQGAGRRTRDIAAIQVVQAVVTSAPDLVEVVAVLNGATQVRANCRKGKVLSLGGHQQESGAGSQAKNLGAVWFQI